MARTFSACDADGMNDPLFSRAQLAIEESRELRYQSRAVKTQQDDARCRLRRTVFESKMHRSEIIARRKDSANHNERE